MCVCILQMRVLAEKQLLCVLCRWPDTHCIVYCIQPRMPAGHILAGIDREQRRRMKKQQWKSIAVCWISAPSMRKMHFSSVLVHWLGPGGKTLRVWCRTFLRLSLFSMCSLGPAQKDAQMLGTSKTQMINDEMLHFPSRCLHLCFSLLNLSTLRYLSWAI